MLRGIRESALSVIVDYRDGKGHVKRLARVGLAKCGEIWQRSRCARHDYQLPCGGRGCDGCQSSSRSTVDEEGDHAPEEEKTRLQEVEDAIFVLSSEEHADVSTVELDSAEKTCVGNQLETWLKDANAVLDDSVQKTDLRSLCWYECWCSWNSTMVRLLRRSLQTG